MLQGVLDDIGLDPDRGKGNGVRCCGHGEAMTGFDVRAGNGVVGKIELDVIGLPEEALGLKEEYALFCEK